MNRAGDELKIEPQSFLLMFSPPSLNWNVGNGEKTLVKVGERK